MPVYEIYLITNKCNNKHYVGQVIKSKGYIERFNEHIYESFHNFSNETRDRHSMTVLHKAIKKYGVENFDIELIEDDISEEDIDSRERYWIEFYKSFYKDNGYNMTTGGQGVHSYCFTDEVRKMMSNNAKAYWKNLKENCPDKYNEWCNHCREINIGRKRSDETRKKLSLSAQQRVGEKNSFYGKHHNDHTKSIISDTNSKRVGMFDMNGNFCREFKSLEEAVQYLIDSGLTNNKLASSRISKICRGIDKSAYGYIWKFL